MDTWRTPTGIGMALVPVRPMTGAPAGPMEMGMNIGEFRREWVVEPVEMPVPAPIETPAPVETPEPVETPS